MNGISEWFNMAMKTLIKELQYYLFTYLCKIQR